MWLALISLGGLGIVLATILAIAYTKLAVKVSEKKKKTLAALPGSNCGACGFPGCEGYAEALVKKEAETGLCPVGGKELSTELAEILGVAAKVLEAKVAVLRCCGSKSSTHEKFDYVGIKSCKGTYFIADGPKSCRFGCLGFGDCIEVCPFDAIKMGDEGLPVIDDKKCTGCGNCVKVCPRNIIELAPKPQKVFVSCNSLDSVKATKGVCKTGCIGCGLCERSCPYDAIKVENNIARIDFDKCENCAICVSKCPTHSIIDKLGAKRPKAIIDGKCTGCQACVEVCPTEAIEGNAEEQHKVILDRCIGCALCYKICKPKAITMAFSLGYSKE